MRQAARSRGPTGLETARISRTGTPCAAAASATPKPSIASASAAGGGPRSSAARSAVPVTVETVRTVPVRAPVAVATARTRSLRRAVGDGAEAQFGDGTKPSGVSAPRSAAMIASATTSEPTGRLGLEAAGDTGGDDQVVRPARQGGGGQRGGGGGGGEGGADTGGEDVVVVRGRPEAVEGRRRESRLGGGARERSCHRVPFGGDGGGYEDAHGRRPRIRRPVLELEVPDALDRRTRGVLLDDADRQRLLAGLTGLGGEEAAFSEWSGTSCRTARWSACCPLIHRVQPVVRRSPGRRRCAGLVVRARLIDLEGFSSRALLGLCGVDGVAVVVAARPRR